MLLAWLATACAVALAESLGPQLSGPSGFDWTVWRSDLTTLSPFMFTLVFGPALLGSLVMRAIIDGRHDTSRATPDRAHP